MKGSLSLILVAALLALAHGLPRSARDQSESAGSGNPNAETVLILPNLGSPLGSPFDNFPTDDDSLDPIGGFGGPYNRRGFSGFMPSIENFFRSYMDQAASAFGKIGGMIPWGSLPEGANTTSTTKILALRKKRHQGPGEVSKSCHSDEFQCKDSSACLSTNKICDGIAQCLDSSDEAGCANRTCGPAQESNVCSQVCNNLNGTYECGCFPGYALRTDRISCKPINQTMEFITATKDDIRRIPASLEVIEVVHRQPQVEISGLDVNVQKSSVYWSSESLGSIHEFNLKTREYRTISNIGRPRVLAVDWITDNIYYFDTVKPETIKVCNINEIKCAVILRLEDNATISAIAFDPKDGFIFWGQMRFPNFGTPISEIWRVGVDGEISMRIADMGEGVVSGITIDQERRMLYWVDATRQVVERSTLNGRDREVFKKDQVHQPIGINVYEDAVYWLMGSSGVMQKCMLMAERKCVEIPLKSSNVEGLFVISHESRQPIGNNACYGHSCDYMCVQNEGIPMCICQDGTEQNANRKCRKFGIPNIRFNSTSLLNKDGGSRKTEGDHKQKAGTRNN